MSEAVNCRGAMPVLEIGLQRLNFQITPDQASLFVRYCSLLQEASRRVNLTGVRDPEGIMRTLFLDSISLSLALPDWARDGSRIQVVDIGSGAGLPGVPLKILFPSWHLTLVESVGKKATFLTELMESLGLKAVEVLYARAEDAARARASRGTADLAFARAVASLPTLLEYAAPFVRDGGLLLFPKSGEVGREIAEAEEAARRLGAARPAVTPVPEELGLGQGRVIVAYERHGPVPSGYPRRTGLARSRPIGSRP